MGSKSSIGGGEGTEKLLPIIKRGKGGFRDRESSVHQEKSTSKRDIADLKADLQAWLSNYLNEAKNKDNL